MSARERWAGFLKQIEARHADLVREAFEAAKEALPETGYDTSPIAVALSAVRARLQDLELRILGTWDEKVEHAFEAEGIGHAERSAARHEGELLKRRLERQRERLEPHAFAYAAHEIHRRALAQRKDVNCARCGAPLAPPISYRAIEVRCGSCGAVGTYEPGDWMRLTEAVGAHAVAWVAAEREWLAMVDAEDQAREQRSPTPLVYLQAYEAAQIQYWTRYYQVQAQMMPEVAASFDKYVRSRLQFWYTYTAEHEAEWVRAGRPRRLPPP